MNIIEITQTFPTELDCIQFFEKHRWGKVKLCPFCNSADISNRAKDYRFHCMECNKSFSVTTATHLHNTRLTLQQWLFAFSIVSDAKKGLSALQLKRNLNISYPTSWSIYHKIRELMSIENEEIRTNELDGIVEMDETYIGGKPRPGGYKVLPKGKKEYLDKRLTTLQEQGFEFKTGNRKVVPSINVKRGRGTDNIPVVGIVQRDGNVVAQVVNSIGYSNLKKMVMDSVNENEAVLITDDLPAYNKMDRIIEHIKVNHKQMFSYRGINTNTIESFWAIIKRQIIGQHHQVSPKHLPKYVDEVVFKFNNRKEDDMFVTLVKKSMLPYEGKI